MVVPPSAPEAQAASPSGGLGALERLGADFLGVLLLNLGVCTRMRLVSGAALDACDAGVHELTLHGEPTRNRAFASASAESAGWRERFLHGALGPPRRFRQLRRIAVRAGGLAAWPTLLSRLAAGPAAGQPGLLALTSLSLAGERAVSSSLPELRDALAGLPALAEMDLSNCRLFGALEADAAAPPEALAECLLACSGPGHRLRRLDLSANPLHVDARLARALAALGSLVDLAIADDDWYVTASAEAVAVLAAALASTAQLGGLQRLVLRMYTSDNGDAAAEELILAPLVAALGTMRGLRDLDLDTRYSNVGMSVGLARRVVHALAQLSQLTRLVVAADRDADQILPAALRGMAGLRELAVRGADDDRLTVAALSTLAHLTALRLDRAASARPEDEFIDDEDPWVPPPASLHSLRGLRSLTLTAVAPSPGGLPPGLTRLRMCEKSAERPEAWPAGQHAFAELRHLSLERLLLPNIPGGSAGVSAFLGALRGRMGGLQVLHVDWVYTETVLGQDVRDEEDQRSASLAEFGAALTPGLTELHLSFNVKSDAVMVLNAAIDAGSLRAIASLKLGEGIFERRGIPLRILGPLKQLTTLRSIELNIAEHVDEFEFVAVQTALASHLPMLERLRKMRRG